MAKQNRNTQTGTKAGSKAGRSAAQGIQQAGQSVATAINNATNAAAQAHAPKCHNAAAASTLQVLIPNPKKPGSLSHARYAKALHGSTVATNLAVVGGLTSADIRWGLQRGQFALVAPTQAK